MNIMLFRHAYTLTIDHDHVIGHTSCNRVSIVFLFPTPRATMNFYIIVVVYIHSGLHVFQYPVFYLQIHCFVPSFMCVFWRARKLIYS